MMFGKIPTLEGDTSSSHKYVYKLFDINYKVNGKSISISNEELKLYFEAIERGLNQMNVQSSTDTKKSDILEITIQVEENWSQASRYISRISFGLLPHTSRIKYSCDFLWTDIQGAKRKKIKADFEVKGFYHLFFLPYILFESPLQLVQDNLTQVGKAVATKIVSEPKE
jgi:hypothetical protein